MIEGEIGGKNIAKLVSKLRDPQQSVRILWLLTVAYVVGVGLNLFQLSTPLLHSNPRPLRFVVLFVLFATIQFRGAHHLSGTR
jgi:hypothetical protein